MILQLSELENEFLADHRQMTRRICRLLEKLQTKDLIGMDSMARELDELAGPHIEFEETVLYPSLIPTLGAPMIARFYEEHGEGLAAIRTLRHLDGSKPLDPGIRELCKRQLRTTLRHAETCATLLGHLAALTHAQQRYLLQRLRQARRTGRAWSELHPAVTAES